MNHMIKLLILGLSQIAPTSSLALEPAQAALQPILENSVETIEEGVVGLGLCEKNLWILPENQVFVVKTPFDDTKKDRKGRFGTFLDSKRITIPKILPSTFHGFSCDKDYYYFLDGKNIEVLKVDKDLAYHGARSIIWDRVKPPKDVRGEPTEFETQRLRKNFHTAMNNAMTAEKRPIVSWAPIPENWHERKTSDYMVLSSLAEYPFLLMSCHEDDKANCALSRACFVESPVDVSQAIGLGLTKDRKIKVAYSKGHVIQTFYFKSCFQITALDMQVVSKEIKPLSGLYIDPFGHLWLSSLIKSDASNASLFLFD